MGFFKSLWNKAKGVLGRAWEGIKTTAKKVAPHIGNVLNTIGDFTGIKALNMAGNLFNTGKRVYESLSGDGSIGDKFKTAVGGVQDAAGIIKNGPSYNETVAQGRDFVRGQVEKLPGGMVRDAINSGVDKIADKITFK